MWQPFSISGLVPQIKESNKRENSSGIVYAVRADRIKANLGHGVCVCVCARISGLFPLIVAAVCARPPPLFDI